MTNSTDITELFSLFGVAPPEFQVIDAAAVPEPYHELLVHHHHMTVTIEKFHGGSVDVRILDRRKIGDTYSRMILLERAADRQVVLFGIVRIRLADCPPAVRAAIEAEQKPLGRVLIEHGVMRRIEPTAYLQFDAAPILSNWFPVATATYGRTGIIHVHERPAVELIEIVAPVESP